MKGYPIKVYNASNAQDMLRAWHVVNSLDGRPGLFTVVCEGQSFQATVQKRQVVVHVGEEVKG